MPGICNQAGVINRATVTFEGGENVQTYTGLAENFKTRFSKHKTSMTAPTSVNTTLSTHYLKQRSAGHQPSISWKFLETNVPTYNPVTGNFKLCLHEKFQIAFNPDMSTLNSNGG